MTQDMSINARIAHLYHSVQGHYGRIETSRELDGDAHTPPWRVHLYSSGTYDNQPNEYFNDTITGIGHTIEDAIADATTKVHAHMHAMAPIRIQDIDQDIPTIEARIAAIKQELDRIRVYA